MEDKIDKTSVSEYDGDTWYKKYDINACFNLISAISEGLADEYKESYKKINYSRKKITDRDYNVLKRTMENAVRYFYRGIVTYAVDTPGREILETLRYQVDKECSR